MRNLFLKNMIISALFLSIGLVFHTVVPGVLFGMKPDFILAFMFIAFLLSPNYKNAFIIGLAGGILSGLTTSLTGGFLPNLIDKMITMHLVYILYLVLNTLFKHVLKLKFDTNFIVAPVLSLVGTVISGTVFLLTAILLGALPMNLFVTLFIGVVIPATIGNIVIIVVVYYALNLSLRRSSIISIEV